MCSACDTARKESSRTRGTNHSCRICSVYQTGDHDAIGCHSVLGAPNSELRVDGVRAGSGSTSDPCSSAGSNACTAHAEGPRVERLCVQPDSNENPSMCTY